QDGWEVEEKKTDQRVRLVTMQRDGPSRSQLTEGADPTGEIPLQSNESPGSACDMCPASQCLVARIRTEFGRKECRIGMRMANSTLLVREILSYNYFHDRHRARSRCNSQPPGQGQLPSQFVFLAFRLWIHSAPRICPLEENLHRLPAREPSLWCGNL